MAHPDDESMGNGGMILRHTRAGVQVHLICATRGGAGWSGRPAGRRPDELPQIRTDELRAAAAALGIRQVTLWDYPDGSVIESDQEEITERIADVIVAIQPDVVVGWGPDGGYRHPDHIAIGACTDRALAALPPDRRPVAHYWMTVGGDTAAGYRQAFDEAGLDGNGLPLVAFDDLSAVFLVSDEELAARMRAIYCHESQIEPWLERLRGRRHLQRRVYGRDGYRRPDGPYERRLLASGLFPELEAQLAVAR
jgi:LmbE family N-acetylglucosaminyl deacetylase